MQRLRAWSLPVISGLWTLILLHACIPHSHAAAEGHGDCHHHGHDHAGMQTDWIGHVMHAVSHWVHHHEHGQRCGHIDHEFVCTKVTDSRTLDLIPCLMEASESVQWRRAPGHAAPEQEVGPSNAHLPRMPLRGPPAAQSARSVAVA